MKATLLYATFAMVLGAPAAFSKSELETLRDRCSEQESQIRRLEDENARLKGHKEAAKPTLAPVVAAPANDQAPKGGSYTVRSGDTLERISRKTGVSVAQLGKANNIKATTVIHPGLVLKLPGKAAASNSATRTVSTPAPKQEKEKEKPAAKPEATSAPSSRTISNPAPAASKTVSNPAPQPAAQAKAERPAEPAAKATAAATTGGGAKPVIRSIIIQDETNYGAFASSHGTTADRLNELNGLSLSTSTVLAKGSELYIPAQP